MLTTFVRSSNSLALAQIGSGSNSPCQFCLDLPYFRFHLSAHIKTGLHDCPGLLILAVNATYVCSSDE